MFMERAVMWNTPPTQINGDFLFVFLTFFSTFPPPYLFIVIAYHNRLFVPWTKTAAEFV